MAAATAILRASVLDRLSLLDENHRFCQGRQYAFVQTHHRPPALILMQSPMIARTTRLVLVIAAAACAAVVIYVLTRVALGSAVLSFGVGTVYVIVPLAATAIFAALARSSSEMRAAALLTLTCVVTTLFAFELRLDLAEQGSSTRSLAVRAARAAGQRFDRRTALDVVDSLRRAGIPAYPALYGPFIARASLSDISLRLVLGRDTILPLAGAPNRVTVYCNESGRFDIYRSDAGGFNNDPAVWADPHPDVVVVGDSYVAGACVPRDSGFVNGLVASGLSAVNLGVGGSGPLQQLARLREFAAPRKPRVLLWAYMEGNDLEDLRRELTNATLREYLTPHFTQHLASFGDRLGVAVEERLDSVVASYQGRPSLWMRIRRLSAARVILLLSLRENLRVPSLSTGAAVESRCCDFESFNYGMFNQVLTQARDEVAAWGGRLVVVIIPDNIHFSTPDGRFCQKCVAPPYLDTLTTARHRGIEIARRLGLAVIDLHEPFLRQPLHEPLFRFAGSHFSPAGYRLAADVVLRELHRFRLRSPDTSTGRMVRESNKSSK